MRSSLVAIAFCCCCSIVQAQQNPIDRYINTTPIATVVADSKAKVSSPQDLDFCRVPGREKELWILNKGDANGGTVVIVYNAGTSTQWTEYRHDSHAGHFMMNASGIAMAANGNFGTSADIRNTAGNTTSTFMGPALWDSDTALFARINQNNWIENEPLGSHLDMLHESPFTMGIAADTGNVYWVFDGFNKAIYRYDFQDPHGYGEDDHSNGIVREFAVPVKRVASLPSHLVLDESTGWLYAVDNGNNRILRVQTRSGEVTDELFTQNELLVEYSLVEGVKVETLDSGLTKLCGIDYFQGRLIVSANSTGVIRIYDVTVNPPEYLGSVNTGEAGIMGVKVGPDSAIWYVNKTKNKVVRITPGEPLSVELSSDLTSASLYPNPANATLTIDQSSLVGTVRVVDALGRTMKHVDLTTMPTTVDVSDLTNGIYYLVSEDEASFHRFVVSR